MLFIAGGEESQNNFVVLISSFLLHMVPGSELKSSDGLYCLATLPTWEWLYMGQ